MKLATYEFNDKVRLGALTTDMQSVVDLNEACIAYRGESSATLSSMLALIESSDEGLALARECLLYAEDHKPTGAMADLSQVSLRAPLRPPRVLCFNVYAGHVKQAFEAGITMRTGKAFGEFAKRICLVRLPKSFYKRPLYYKGNNLSVIGPNDQVLWPCWTNQLDYELELGVVIGKAGKNISANDAMKHVFGFTCFNDFSARDVRLGDLLSGVGPITTKDFDTGNAIGPWIVTADEIPDPYDLNMTVRVNGEVRSTSSTSLMSHPIQSMIACASEEEHIVQGEFIGTGAATNGCGMELMRFLEPDDFVEIEIDRIGVLRNQVVKAT